MLILIQGFDSCRGCEFCGPRVGLYLHTDGAGALLRAADAET